MTLKSMMDCMGTNTRARSYLLMLKMNTSRPPRKPVRGSHGRTISAPVLFAGQHCSRQVWTSQRSCVLASGSGFFPAI